MSEPKGWRKEEEARHYSLKAQYFRSKRKTQELWDDYMRSYNDLEKRGFREGK